MSLKSYLLEKSIKKMKGNEERVGSYISIENAKYVGFIFDLSNEGIIEAVSYLKKYLREKDISYAAIALDVGKEGMAVPNLDYDENVLRLNKEDFNWYKVPKPGKLKDFISKPFDILIDLTIFKKNKIYTNFIVETAIARLKVGTDISKMDIYDIVIDKDHSKENISQEEYVEKILDYLIKIKQ